MESNKNTINNSNINNNQISNNTNVNSTNSIASRVNALKMHMAAKGGNPMANFIMGARKNDQQ